MPIVIMKRTWRFIPYDYPICIWNGKKAEAEKFCDLERQRTGKAHWIRVVPAKAKGEGK